MTLNQLLAVLLGIIGIYLAYKLIFSKRSTPRESPRPPRLFSIRGRRGTGDHGLIIEKSEEFVPPTFDVFATDIALIVGSPAITGRGYVVRRDLNRPLIVVHPVIVYKYLKLRKRQV